TLRGLTIDHVEPETRIGRITRPLIFPVAAFEYCRVRWPEARRVRASFPGLPTSSRTKIINEWLKLSNLELRVPEDIGERSRDNFVGRISRAVAPWLGVSARQQIYSEGVKFVFSDEGRVFPRKAWNVDYYSCLLEAEFVLCPDGKDVGGSPWTYRFFES